MKLCFFLNFNLPLNDFVDQYISLLKQIKVPSGTVVVTHLFVKKYN